ncbi:MAG: methyl-accepting chemotaxis protein [Magnetococcus sp. DMHC-8]
MLNNMKLSGQLTVLFLFLGLTALGMGLFVIHVNHRLEERLTRLDREDVPLALAVSEVSRQQLEQLLHINAAFLFGETDDRGKFEMANERFANAGRRLTNVLVEARYLAQKGMESAKSEGDKRQLEQVKSIISDFQKIHADFEHLAGGIIRSIYKYRFLTKAGIITGNGNQTLAEAEQEYLKNLSNSSSSLDDETRRLEGKLKQAFDATRELSRNLSTEASREHYVAWVAFVLTMTLFTVGGLSVLLSIHASQQGRLRQRADALRTMAEPFRKKADFLLHSAQQIGGTFVHLTSNDDSRQDSMRALGSALTVLSGLTASNLRIMEEAGSVAREMAAKARQADQLILNFNEITNRSAGLCEQIHRNLQSLNSNTMQVNLLATSASAEASRQEASRGFAIFTDEIKGLSQTIVQIIESVVVQLETACREIGHGRDDVKQASGHFGTVTEGALQLTDWSGEVKSAAHKQAELIADVQGELAMLRDMATANYHLIQQSGVANQTMGEQTEEIATLIRSLLALILVEERRADQRSRLLPAETPEGGRTAGRNRLTEEKTEEENADAAGGSGGSG